MDGAHPKLARLHQLLDESAPMLLAYSGGVDSAFLLAAAHRTLGARVTAVIADSASLPRAALAEAVALARQIGAPLEVVSTGELDNPEYASNPPNRCYFCKAELFARMEGLARDRGFRTLAYGENADDAQQIRPGVRAAAEFEVRAPLKEAGLTKAEIRAFSRALGLPTADAPAQPCLSSRIPHGTPVTTEALAQIERGEQVLRDLGFRVLRVRHLTAATPLPAGCPPLSHPDATLARVLVAPDELPRLTEQAEAIRAGLIAAGYEAVFLDPEGYRPPR